ncbi:MAG TPA: hypothetical protein VHB98_16120, partial [Chloroflexota bacterium]|nr:hypothetical protein [Chloroflexota bacterium]
MDQGWDWRREPPICERPCRLLDDTPAVHVVGPRGTQDACRRPAVFLERWRAGDPIAVPGWLPPLALTNLALYVVYLLDHQSTYRHPLLVLAGTGALVALFAAIVAAVLRGAGRPASGRLRVATLALIGAMAANTAVSAILVLPHLAQTNRYATDAAAATDCGATLFIQGHNPYSNLHMLGCLQRHGLGPAQTTPRQAGTFWVFATYPSPITAHFQYLLYRV